MKAAKELLPLRLQIGSQLPALFEKSPCLHKALSPIGGFSGVEDLLGTF